MFTGEPTGGEKTHLGRARYPGNPPTRLLELTENGV
jgi:hypothetical protein